MADFNDLTKVIIPAVNINVQALVTFDLCKVARNVLNSALVVEASTLPTFPNANPRSLITELVNLPLKPILSAAREAANDILANVEAAVDEVRYPSAKIPSDDAARFRLEEIKPPPALA
jgi:hypothetical protein